jgi:hypothetical protein
VTQLADAAAARDEADELPGLAERPAWRARGPVVLADSGPALVDQVADWLGMRARVDATSGQAHAQKAETGAVVS